MDVQPREFRPEVAPRRGEIIAWSFAILSGLSALFLRSKVGSAPFFVWLFVGLLVLSALSISLGNWMDRRTLIRLDAQGVEYQNGLRHVRLTWPQIKALSVSPTKWGNVVEVLGEQTHFFFRTLGEVGDEKKVVGRIGFAAGDEILNTILQASGLHLREKTSDGYYYSRL